MSKRDISYDVLKVIGMIGIFLAHTLETPTLINYLRNYEVFLLVIISGVFLGRKRIKNYREYVLYLRKRIPRLVIPTWFFLLLLFSGIYLICKLTHQHFPYSSRIVIESFTMTGGIGYVWIMLVYCLIAAGSPLINTMLDRVKKTNKFVVISLMWVVYEILLFVLSAFFEMGMMGYFIKNVLMYLLSYSIIGSLGYVIDDSTVPRILTFIISVSLLIGHIILFLFPAVQEGVLESLAGYKYPPSFLYASYGIAVSLLLVLLIQYILDNVESNVAKSFFSFFGKRVNWIYFNHIFMIYIWNMLVHYTSWILMFLFLSIGSVLLTFLVDLALRKLDNISKSKVLRSVIQLIWGQI